LQRDPANARVRERVAPALRWRGGKRCTAGLEPAAGKENTMIVAFALALVGMVVFGSLHIAAAH
jgi:hypothetical protein